jgi:hypothetical protein
VCRVCGVGSRGGGWHLEIGADNVESLGAQHPHDGVDAPGDEGDGDEDLDTLCDRAVLVVANLPRPFDQPNP